MNIAILSLSAYNVLSSDEKLTHIGGAEVQIAAIAHGLSDRGHAVSFVTFDHGQPDGIKVDGIRVFKAFSEQAGLPILRFIWPRWTTVWAALSRAHAEICMQVGADCWTGVAASWCRRAGRPFVFVSMSEADCDARLPFLTGRLDRILYRYGLRRADSVVVQTEGQRSMLCESFGINSVVVRPCCGTPSYDGSAASSRARPARELLWIGRYSREKRLEWFLDIAEACPDLVCHVVGAANSATDYASNLRSRAGALPNVIEHGFIPQTEMGGLYRKAGLLVTTSEIEGFPTTFMEAWARGVPTVATVDPDGLIGKYELGAVAHDVPGLIAALRSLLDSPERWKQASANVRRYYLENHTIEAAMPRFEAVFLDALKHPPGGAATRG